MLVTLIITKFHCNLDFSEEDSGRDLKHEVVCYHYWLYSGHLCVVIIYLSHVMSLF